MRISPGGHPDQKKVLRPGAHAHQGPTPIQDREREREGGRETDTEREGERERETDYIALSVNKKACTTGFRIVACQTRHFRTEGLRLPVSLLHGRTRIPCKIRRLKLAHPEVQAWSRQQTLATPKSQRSFRSLDSQNSECSEPSAWSRR